MDWLLHAPELTTREVNPELAHAQYVDSCTDLNPPWKEQSPRSINKLESNKNGCATGTNPSGKDLEKCIADSNVLYRNNLDFAPQNHHTGNGLDISGMMPFVQPRADDASCKNDSKTSNPCSFDIFRNKLFANPATAEPPMECSSVGQKPASRGRGAPRKLLKTNAGKASSQSALKTAQNRQLSKSKESQPTAEQKRKIRQERNRESAEISRLRRKQYTSNLERDVGIMREVNKTLKKQTITLLAALRKIDNDVAKCIAKGEGFASDAPTGGTALKAAILALENAKQQCVMTFCDAACHPEIPLKVKKQETK